MANPNTIRVSEYEKLYFDENKPFKHKHWSALCKYMEGHKGLHGGNAEYFKILNKGIQFTNYVGVIQAGDLTIEVLPKTDSERTTAANCTVADLELRDRSEASSRQGWHNVLLQMLKECNLLKINHVDYANLNLKANSILEVYLELLLNHTEKILHEGLVKKYRKEEGNTMAMKGQLLFAKNISKNLVHREQFYVRQTNYNRVNIYNQIIYKTLQMVPLISKNYSLSKKTNRLLLDFPEMPDCRVTPATFARLEYDRKTERYREAILICKMLLLNYRPDITGGRVNVIAILFDMNVLWEEFIYRRLLSAASSYESDVHVYKQRKKPFWFHTLDAYYKSVKPDIVVKKEGNLYILDTKWKIVNNNSPDDADLKQLFVYNLLWNANQSFLVYPGSDQPIDGSYLHFKLSEYERLNEDDVFYNHCSMFFVNPINNYGSLNTNVGMELLRYLKPKNFH